MVLPTTLARNDAGLLRQLQEVTRYRTRIDEAAGRHGLTVAMIGGVGSRESHWGLILKPAGSGPAGTGDALARRFPTQFRTGPLPPDGGGFGRGLMQIDFDAHEFARTGTWRDPGENILNGCKVLADSRDPRPPLDLLLTSRRESSPYRRGRHGPAHVPAGLRTMNPTSWRGSPSTSWSP